MTTQHNRINKNGFALRSTVTDGLLCIDGHTAEVSTDFDEGGRFEGLVRLFNTIEEANEYINENEYYALEPTEFQAPIN